MNEESYILQLIGELGSKPGISDIHLAVGKPVWVRANGLLQTYPDYTISEKDAGLFNSMSGTITDKSSADFSISYNNLRFRVNMYHSDTGGASLERSSRINYAVRVLPTSVPTLTELHMPPQILELQKARTGLILVSGTTGSGKSTTLASLLNFFNQQQSLNIITLEDPVEYLFNDDKSRISQRQVGKDVASFAEGIRDAMREDPDIIYIGELRDLPTARAAIEAAETGHLVLASVHSKSTPGILPRISTLFPNDERDAINFQLTGVLHSAMHMQLIRTHNMRVPLIDLLYNDTKMTNLLNKSTNGQTNQVYDEMLRSETSFTKGLCAKWLHANNLLDLADVEAQVDRDTREQIKQGLKSVRNLDD